MTRDEALWKARNAADDEAKTWWRETGNQGTSFNWSERFHTSLAASGFAVVPVEATEEMAAAAVGPIFTQRFAAKRIYEAMLAAAQEDSHE